MIKKGVLILTILILFSSLTYAGSDISKYENHIKSFQYECLSSGDESCYVGGSDKIDLDLSQTIYLVNFYHDGYSGASDLDVFIAEIRLNLGDEIADEVERYFSESDMFKQGHTEICIPGEFRCQEGLTCKKTNPFNVYVCCEKDECTLFNNCTAELSNYNYGSESFYCLDGVWVESETLEYVDCKQYGDTFFCGKTEDFESGCGGYGDLKYDVKCRTPDGSTGFCMDCKGCTETDNGLDPSQKGQVRISNCIEGDEQCVLDSFEEDECLDFNTLREFYFADSSCTVNYNDFACSRCCKDSACTEDCISDFEESCDGSSVICSDDYDCINNICCYPNSCTKNNQCYNHGQYSNGQRCESGTWNDIVCEDCGDGIFEICWSSDCMEISNDCEYSLLTGCRTKEIIVDSDSDGVSDADDNCPSIDNPEQLDLDLDGEGDVCDADADGDGFSEDDCNDLDADIRPNALEIPDDNIDNDCDGVTDSIVTSEEQPENHVVCWGDGQKGALGDGNEDPHLSSGTDVVGLNSDVLELSAGNDHVCVLLDDRKVYCWGSGEWGTLGDGFTERHGSGIPLQVLELEDILDISSGIGHTCAILDDNTVKCWGFGAGARLGEGVTGKYDYGIGIPVYVNGLSGAIKISSGNVHSCAIIDGGSVRCWGSGAFGELGDGNTQFHQVESPVEVLSSDRFIDISCGYKYSCGIIDGGSVKCWGINDKGQLGIGDLSIEETGNPVDVIGIYNAVSITSANYHSCALVDDGTVWCWGSGENGRLGDGDTSDHYNATPRKVIGLDSVKQISCKPMHCCALLEDSSVKCWGSGYRGRLGQENSVNVDSGIPLVVNKAEGAKQISSGGSFSCVIIEGESSMIDNDGDGFDPENDCDDNDPEMYPGNLELCDDGKDNDCDSLIDDLDEEDCQPMNVLVSQIIDFTFESSKGMNNLELGDTFTIIPKYDVSTNDETLTGIGFKIFFDSNVISYEGFDDLYSNSLFDPSDGVPKVKADSSNLDNDINTDYFIMLYYANFGGTWPGQTLPLDLVEFKFKVVSEQTTYIRTTGETAGVYNYEPRNLPYEIYFTPKVCDDIDDDGYGVCPNCGIENDCDFEGNDCDDNDPARYPGNSELCDDNKDNDCDSLVDYFDDQDCTEYIDNDGDGYSVDDGDCDDNDPLRSPVMTEVCDGIDNNCDGVNNEIGCDEYCDTDGDGYIDDYWSMFWCDSPRTDCDDDNPEINPGKLEICDDGIDNDCDDKTDSDDEDCGTETRATLKITAKYRGGGIARRAEIRVNGNYVTSRGEWTGEVDPGWVRIDAYHIKYGSWYTLDPYVFDRSEDDYHICTDPEFYQIDEIYPDPYTREYDAWYYSRACEEWETVDHQTFISKPGENGVAFLNRFGIYPDADSEDRYQYIELAPGETKEVTLWYDASNYIYVMDKNGLKSENMLPLTDGDWGGVGFASFDPYMMRYERNFYDEDNTNDDWSFVRVKTNLVSENNQFFNLFVVNITDYSYNKAPTQKYTLTNLNQYILKEPWQGTDYTNSRDGLWKIYYTAVPNSESDEAILHNREEIKEVCPATELIRRERVCSKNGASWGYDQYYMKSQPKKTGGDSSMYTCEPYEKVIFDSEEFCGWDDYEKCTDDYGDAHCWTSSDRKKECEKVCGTGNHPDCDDVCTTFGGEKCVSDKSIYKFCADADNWETTPCMIWHEGDCPSKSECNVEEAKPYSSVPCKCDDGYVMNPWNWCEEEN